MVLGPPLLAWQAWLMWSNNTMIGHDLCVCVPAVLWFILICDPYNSPPPPPCRRTLIEPPNQLHACPRCQWLCMFTRLIHSLERARACVSTAVRMSDTSRSCPLQVHAHHNHRVRLINALGQWVIITYWTNYHFALLHSKRRLDEFAKEHVQQICVY